MVLSCSKGCVWLAARQATRSVAHRPSAPGRPPPSPRLQTPIQPSVHPPAVGPNCTGIAAQNPGLAKYITGAIGFPFAMLQARGVAAGCEPRNCNSHHCCRVSAAVAA